MDLTPLSSLEDAGSWEPASSAAVRSSNLGSPRPPLLLGALPASKLQIKVQPFHHQPLPVAQHSAPSLSSCSSPALGWKRFITVRLCPLFQVY